MNNQETEVETPSQILQNYLEASSLYIIKLNEVNECRIKANKALINYCASKGYPPTTFVMEAVEKVLEHTAETILREKQFVKANEAMEKLLTRQKTQEKFSNE